MKGPTAKMFAELGLGTPTAAGVAAHYGDLLDGYVMDAVDAAEAARIRGPRVALAQTLMKTLDDREALARMVLDFADCLRAMSTDIWAVIPVKELEGAKQRLSPLLSPEQRQALAA